MKKQAMITLTVAVLSILMLAGCGKSEEEKARDEIMSHMSDEEKAAIAEDQKAIADYEAEKQAKADAIANEKPIDYSEVMTETALTDITFEQSELINIPISVLLPGDEYLYGGKGYDIEMNLARGMHHYGQNQYVLSETFGVLASSSVSGDAEDCGNYTVYTETGMSEIGSYVLFITENNSDAALQISFYSTHEDYQDCVKAMFEKNYAHIKEQLMTAEPHDISEEVSGDTESYDISEEALGDAEPEIFGKYTDDNGNTVEISYGDNEFDITITGFTYYGGTLTWLADDLYESKTDDAWVQVQLTEDGIAVRSSYVYLEGNYVRN